MDKIVLDKILNELEQIDFKGIIHLNLYNEPLADKELCKKIRCIRHRLPKCFVQFNSNGDYLTKDLLEELNDAGVGQMLVTCHTPPTEEYNDEKRMSDIKRLFERLELPFEIKSVTPDKNITCELMYKNIHLWICANNWSDFGNDRGGTLKDLSCNNQEKPCCVPFREIVIDHEGYVRMCCNIFTNENNFGNIMEHSLQEIYFSDRMVAVRRHLLTFGAKMKPCNSCTSPDAIITETDFETVKARNALLKESCQK